MAPQVNEGKIRTFPGGGVRNLPRKGAVTRGIENKDTKLIMLKREHVGPRWGHNDFSKGRNLLPERRGGSATSLKNTLSKGEGKSLERP